MNGSMSEMSTDLPRIRAAIPIETVDSGASPVPLTINTRTNATTCRATKKKIVGGSTAKNSSLSFEVSLLIGSPQEWLYRGPRDGAVRGVTCRETSMALYEKRAGSRGQQFLHEATTRDKGIEPPQSRVRAAGVRECTSRPTSKLQFGLLPSCADESDQQSECTICEKRHVPLGFRPVWLPHEAADTSPAAL